MTYRRIYHAHREEKRPLTEDKSAVVLLFTKLSLGEVDAFDLTLDDDKQGTRGLTLARDVIGILCVYLIQLTILLVVKESKASVISLSRQTYK